MISYSQAVETADKIENINIDVKKTIERAVKAGYLGEDQFYATVIRDESFTYSVDKLLDDNYPKITLDNFYFDIISKALDDEGIYISLAYCARILKSDAECEVIEYDDYELDEDDLFYEVEYLLMSVLLSNMLTANTNHILPFDLPICVWLLYVFTDWWRICLPNTNCHLKIPLIVCLLK